MFTSLFLSFVSDSGDRTFFQNFVKIQPDYTTSDPQKCSSEIFYGVGLTPPLGPLFRSPRFRFLRSLCSSPLGPCKSQHCGHIGLLCIPRMIHEGDCGVIGGANDDCRGNRNTRRKPVPAPLCATTNPTCLGPVSNPGPQRWEASD
jgi:hypothetical protein